MRRPALLLTACLLALVVPASANPCETDLVPAATLLLPYFETTIARTGVETIMTIQNATEVAVAANMVLWTDHGIPVAAVPLALPKYDTVSISLHDLLADGLLPKSDVANLPAGRFPNCRNLLSATTVAPSVLAQIQKALTGQPIASGLCLGSSSPGLMRGYVTIDTVADCTVLLPDDQHYFVNGGTGVATNQNVLWGSSYFVDPLDPAGPMSHAEPMVAIEADGTKTELKTKGNYTFYARLVKWEARDNREPLPTDFGARFNLGPGAGMATELVVWRDPRRSAIPFACNRPPLLFPNLTKHQYVFNEDGDAWEVTPNRLTLATQRLRVGFPGTGAGYVIPNDAGEFGWIFLNLNHSRPAGVPVNGPFLKAAQGWVYGMVTSPPYIASYEAVRFDFACHPDVGMVKPKP